MSETKVIFISRSKPISVRQRGAMLYMYHLPCAQFGKLELDSSITSSKCNNCGVSFPNPARVTMGIDIRRTDTTNPTVLVEWIQQFLGEDVEIEVQFDE